MDTSPVSGAGSSRGVERIRLRELIEAGEAEHGPVDPAAVAAKAALLRADPQALAVGGTGSGAGSSRGVERDRLRELIEAGEAEHGPVDPAAVAAKAALLRADPQAPAVGGTGSGAGSSRGVERIRLRELIEAGEAEHGPVDPVAVAAKAALLRADPQAPAVPGAPAPPAAARVAPVEA
ncbi:hypothetical protein [Streptomyces qinzhouensis]|uniref:Uncharacterized protein n=1 Tax=Streptomyces qinzhouensis TaxID=2599401 RepID=A0A5B8J5V8_9ACTN|nr:hypothetical protein [Streptomyces qinzhouensis]QDY77185.1 hypothetical protein FQU76_12405 [Streptomyces qinzhouensis]